MRSSLKEIIIKLADTTKSSTAACVIVIFSVIVIVALVFLLSASAATSIDESIIFNEAVSGNSKTIGDKELGSPDWIEIYNASSEDIDLTGYRLSDNKNSLGTELKNAVIKKDGYLVIYASKNNTPHDIGLCCVNFGISSEGETLFLISPNNTLEYKFTIPALYTDVSYARKGDGSYGFCTETTPGSQNSEKIMDADELKALLGSGKLTLSEVLPKTNDGYAWAEVYNSGTSDIYLGNYCLTDDESNKAKWHFPGRMLKPGEFVTVSFSGQAEDDSDMHASFKLGNTDTSLFVYDVSGNCCSALKWDKEIPYEVSVVGDKCYTAYPTCGKANSPETMSSIVKSNMDSSDPVRINEVLPKNTYGIYDTDGVRSVWAEIYNSGSENVNLKGYFLSDDENDLFKWAFPDTVIEPKSYKVIFFSGKSGKEGELHASFRLSEGEPVYLTNINGFRVDSMHLPETTEDNISVGRDENGKTIYFAYPTPCDMNAQGFEDPSQTGSSGQSGVYISEVSAASKAKNGENDWIEIHNASNSRADLKGYYLSDDKNDLKKWQISSLTIEPEGYTVIEASALAKQETGVAAFSISPSGETLLLSNPYGAVIDVFQTGVLSPGITSGRLDSNAITGRVFFTAPTRGASNSTEYKTGYTAMPEFSETGLYHTDAFRLGITCSVPGASIYYTTDGSVPTSASKAYKEPIDIKSNTVIRAVAYSEGLMPSAVKTSTFIFDAPHTIPVVCLAGKPSEIRRLLMIDHSYYNRKPEYKANFEYYEKDGTLGVSFESGLRPKGNYSMNYRQKSFVVRLRSSYGQNSVSYPFFEGSKITSFNALCLRSSGQDYPYTRIRDSYFQNVAKGMNLETLNTKLVAAYINGEYYGLYDLGEEQNESYITSYFGTESGNIDIINRDGSVIAGDNDEFKRIENMARTMDLSDDAQYAEFSKYVDVDAFIDFLVMQIYFANGDVSNLRYWRAQDYSVKWRPMLHDLDWSLRYANGKGNAFGKYFNWHVTSGRGAVTKTYIPSALKKNKGWRDKFVERYVELAETQFSNERILPIYDSLVSEMEPEMPQHIKKYHNPRNMDYWHRLILKLRGEIENRKTVALKQLQRSFNVSDERIQELIQKYSVKQ